MLTRERAYRITKVVEVTLAATAEEVTVDTGLPFQVCNPETGTDTAYIGPSSAECLWPVAPGSKNGPYVVPAGDSLYAKGVAGKKLLLMYVE